VARFTLPGIDNLNPLYTNMWFSSITHQIWNCWAWDFDDQNNALPRLLTEIPSADNGGITEEGKVITMKLRDDIVWSDGTPITAEDFIFTYQMTIDPKNTVASAYPYDQMTSVEAPDEHTVVITFAEPFAPWLGTLWHGILPKHVLARLDADGTIDNAEEPRPPLLAAALSSMNDRQLCRLSERKPLGRAPKLMKFIRFVRRCLQIAASKPRICSTLRLLRCS
jgi:ABC-type transport system substrate-binding protein